MSRQKGFKQSKKTIQKIKKARAKQVPPTLGKHWKYSPEALKHFKEIIKKGKDSWNWKGDNVGYYSVHNWIERWKGIPKICERCGTTTAKKFEWANKDHTYKRILDDYIRMCTPCHRTYDKNRGVKVSR